MWRTWRWSKHWVAINCFKSRNHCKSLQNSVHRPPNEPKIKQGLMYHIFIEILEGERCLHSLFNTVSWTRKTSTASQLGKKMSSQLVTPIYIGDESWKFQYDPETKHQSMADERNHHRGPRSLQKLTIKQCWPVVYINREWFTKHMCMKEKQWSVNSMYRWHKHHWSRFQEWGHNMMRKAVGFFCTTMPHSFCHDSEVHPGK